MKPPQPAVFALALLGTFAALQQVFGAVRPLPVGGGEPTRLVVSSPEDAGEGSLREALFAAARSDRRATVVLRVPSIRLATPLPPAFNPHGLDVESAGAPVLLDASALESGPALDLAAPGARVSGLHVKGAREVGILVRGSDTRIRRVEVSGGGDGIVVWEGATEVGISEARFLQNRVGVRVSGSDSRVDLVDNRFEGQAEAAVWAVRPHGQTPASSARLRLRRNRIVAAGHGVVVGNGAASVVENEIVASRDAAIVLLESEAQVERNRVREGRGVGILVDASPGSRVADNEVDHNRAAGILVRSSADVEVRGNRLHSNGYGIMSVFGRRSRPAVLVDNLLLRNLQDGIIVIGGSVLIQGNRATGNQMAGLRVVDYVRRNGTRLNAEPFLEENVWDGNQRDEPVREEWIEPPEDGEKGR